MKLVCSWRSRVIIMFPSQLNVLTLQSSIFIRSDLMMLLLLTPWMDDIMKVEVSFVTDKATASYHQIEMTVAIHLVGKLRQPLEPMRSSIVT